MKHDGKFVEYVQHGSVPVLQYRQARHSMRYFSGCHTAMNNANTVGQPRELLDIVRGGGNSLQDFLPDQA